MRQNRIRSIWKAGGAVVNGWLAIPAGFSAETMAHQGWDSLTIDMQHGLIDYQAAVGMLTAISTTGTVPVVRVPWHEPGILMEMLDAGAYALICRIVNPRQGRRGGGGRDLQCAVGDAHCGGGLAGAVWHWQGHWR